MSTNQKQIKKILVNMYFMEQPTYIPAVWSPPNSMSQAGRCIFSAMILCCPTI